MLLSRAGYTTVTRFCLVYQKKPLVNYKQYRMQQRVLTKTRRIAHITPVFKSLHWLPVSFRIDFKIILLVYKSLLSHAVENITDMFSRYTPSRSLRSFGTELLTVPKARTKRHGEAAFSFLCPQPFSLWNIKNG